MEFSIARSGVLRRRQDQRSLTWAGGSSLLFVTRDRRTKKLGLLSSQSILVVVCHSTRGLTVSSTAYAFYLFLNSRLKSVVVEASTETCFDPFINSCQRPSRKKEWRHHHVCPPPASTATRPLAISSGSTCKDYELRSHNKNFRRMSGKTLHSTPPGFPLYGGEQLQDDRFANFARSARATRHGVFVLLRSCLCVRGGGGSVGDVGPTS
jgi:hypothetical protein